jgi:hypothetical protein
MIPVDITLHVILISPFMLHNQPFNVSSICWKLKIMKLLIM